MKLIHTSCILKGWIKLALQSDRGIGLFITHYRRSSRNETDLLFSACSLTRVGKVVGTRVCSKTSKMTDSVVIRKDNFGDFYDVLDEIGQ